MERLLEVEDRRVEMGGDGGQANMNARSIARNNTTAGWMIWHDHAHSLQSAIQIIAICQINI